MENFLLYLQAQSHTIMALVFWLLVFLVGFYLMAIIFPGSRKQPFLRKDMPADMLYWLLGPLLYGVIFSIIFNGFLYYDTFKYIQHQGVRHFSVLPLVVQAFLILLVTDLFQYWIHRFFHRSASLWPFHAIHHSSKHLDWLSSTRFHPINIIIYSTSVNALVATLGFSPEAFALLFPFNMIYSPLVHANLDWSYGPFKYLLVSPIYHRWHHTKSWEGGNKNFAPTFPFIDILFGTFYMPKGVIPMEFGLDEDTMPESFHGQLIHPFRKTKTASETKVLAISSRE